METKKIIEQLIDYIEQNLENRLSLDEIAGKAGYSKFHLNRVFAKYVGCTIYKYIQTRRLTAAAEKLVNTKKPIIEIAQEANYNSQQAFTLAFHQLYGCPPQEYRAKSVYIPKFNRFRMESKLIMLHNFTKCEGIAA